MVGQTDETNPSIRSSTSLITGPLPFQYSEQVNDPMEDFCDPKMAAGQLLESIMKYRKSNLQGFLGFVTDALNEYAAA